MDILALSYIFLLLQASAGLRLSEEPRCSNFVIEEQLLKKMVELEIRSGHMMTEFKELVTSVKEERQEMKQNMEKMTQEFNEIKLHVREEQKVLRDTVKEELDRVRSSADNVTTIMQQNIDKSKEELASSVRSETDNIKAEFQEMQRMALKQRENDNKTLLEGLQATQKITKGLEDILTEYMATTNKSLEKLSNRTSFQPAFTVTSPTSGPISGGVRFTTVITNIGGGYNETTGQFQCEQSGIYFFYLSVYKTTSASRAYCRIRHNNSNKIIAYADPQTRSGYRGRHQASNSLLLHLDTGDTVDIGGCRGISYLYSNSEYTSFSGFLVKAD